MTNIANLWNFDLCRGSTDHPRNGACLYDAANWILYGTVGDDPPSACPVIRSFAFRLNDLLPDAQRQQLKMFIVRVIDNRDRESEAARAEYLVERIAKDVLPIAQKAARRASRDDEIRTFAEIARDQIADAKVALAGAPAGQREWQDAADHAANALEAAAKAAPSTRAKARIYDTAIDVLDGVLAIGAQADPFDEAALEKAIALFDAARIAEEPVGIA